MHNHPRRRVIEHWGCPTGTAAGIILVRVGIPATGVVAAASGLDPGLALEAMARGGRGPGPDLAHDRGQPLLIAARPTFQTMSTST